MSESPPAADDGAEAPRRGFLSQAARVSMLAGLAAGYGTLAAMAGRFLFPTHSGLAWMFVTDARSLPPGGAMPFVSPGGVRVTVQRNAESDLTAPRVEDFAALSSVCPHLGCRVHWEPHNARYFCPCHNGAFDAEGRPTEGPPAAANQHLPRYPLKLEQGLLFIEMPLETLGVRSTLRRESHG